jgi:hypothetical protein
LTREIAVVFAQIILRIDPGGLVFLERTEHKAWRNVSSTHIKKRYKLPQSIRIPLLILGAILTGILGLSVHVFLLQGMHIPYPAGFPHTGIGAWVNGASSVLGAVLVYSLASPGFHRRPFVVRVLALFLLLTMLQEMFFRGPIMDAVVTTAWRFSFLSNVPALLVWLVLSTVIVAIAPYLKHVALKVVASVVLYAAVFLALRPLVMRYATPILAHFSSLAHDEVWGQPYGAHVLIPAYLTFAEPVIACIVIAALLWDQLAERLPLRLLQFTLILLAVKHVLFAPIVFPFYAKMPVLTAMASMGQFTLEAIALAVLGGLTWQFSRRGAR